MKLNDIIEALRLKILSAADQTDVKVNSAYTSDLLSDVMANSKEGMIWITLQIHQNIIAVTKLKELAAVILVNNREPDEDTLQKAEEEKVPVLSTKDSAFIISGKLYQLLKTGK
jgi:hypothetical protein